VGRAGAGGFAAVGQGPLTTSRTRSRRGRSAGRYGIVPASGHGIEACTRIAVLNYGRGKAPAGTRMALAIEPMITQGAPDTVELSDGWTVITRDRLHAVTSSTPWALR